MPEDALQTARPRVPLPEDGIQVNHCKDPRCGHFGEPASPDPQPRGPGAADRGRDPYTLAGAEEERGPSGEVIRVLEPRLVCRCGDRFYMKSNRAVSEELKRFSRHLLNGRPAACPNETCDNRRADVSLGAEYYYRHGRTPSGSPRYKCRKCGRVFSVGRPTLRQKKPRLNALVFRLLVNKVPMKRICEIAGIRAGTLYGKLDFIWKQCLAFAGERERMLPEMRFPGMSIGVDRQVYMLNWHRRKDRRDGTRRNVQLYNVTSADNLSGYVFGAHLDFDPAVQPAEANAQALACGDLELQPAFRRHARLWLDRDYDVAEARRRADRRVGPDRTGRRRTHENLILETYEDTAARPDPEACAEPTDLTGPPPAGIQIHAEYCVYGHFFYLKKLLPGARQITFYMDQESAMRAACHSAFAQDILDGRVEAFYTSIVKDMPLGYKKGLVEEGRRERRRLRELHPDWSYQRIVLEMFRRRIVNARAIGQYGDKWVWHPLPKMSEPMRRISHLTSREGWLTPEEEALLYSLASRQAVDRFFMQVRRMMSLFERAIQSPRRDKRWNGYAPYNPEVAMKALEIFRVHYNFCKKGRDGKTPAMRLGLANAPVSLGEIINFRPAS